MSILTFCDGNEPRLCRAEATVFPPGGACTEEGRGALCKRSDLKPGGALTEPELNKTPGEWPCEFIVEASCWDLRICSVNSPWSADVIWNACPDVAGAAPCLFARRFTGSEAWHKISSEEIGVGLSDIPELAFPPRSTSCVGTCGDIGGDIMERLPHDDRSGSRAVMAGVDVMDDGRKVECTLESHDDLLFNAFPRGSS